MEGDDLWCAAVTGDRDYHAKSECDKQMVRSHHFVNSYDDLDYGSISKDYCSENRPTFYGGRKNYDEGQYNYEDKFRVNIKRKKFEQPRVSRFNLKPLHSEKRQNCSYPGPSSSKNIGGAFKPQVNLSLNNALEIKRKLIENPPRRGSYDVNSLTQKDGIILGDSHDDKVLFYNTRMDSGTDEFKYSHHDVERGKQLAFDDYTRYHYKAAKLNTNKKIPISNFSTYNNNGEQCRNTNDRIRQVYEEKFEEKNKLQRNLSSNLNSNILHGSESRYQEGYRRPQGLNFSKNSPIKHTDHYSDGKVEYVSASYEMATVAKNDFALKSDLKSGHCKDLIHNDKQKYHSQLGNRGKTVTRSTIHGNYPRRHFDNQSSKSISFLVNSKSSDSAEQQDSFIRKCETFIGKETHKEISRCFSEDSYYESSKFNERKSSKEDIKQMLIKAGNESVVNYRKDRGNSGDERKSSKEDVKQMLIKAGNESVVNYRKDRGNSGASSNLFLKSFAKQSSTNNVLTNQEVNTKSDIANTGSPFLVNTMNNPSVTPIINPPNFIRTHAIRTPVNSVRPIAPITIIPPVRYVPPIQYLHQIYPPPTSEMSIIAGYNSVPTSIVHQPAINNILVGGSVGEIKSNEVNIMSGSVVPQPLMETVIIQNQGLIRPNQGPLFLSNQPSHILPSSGSEFLSYSHNNFNLNKGNVENPVADESNKSDLHTPIDLNGILPQPIESKETSEERQQLLQDALKQIDARMQSKTRSNWKINPKKPWFDYQCRVLYRKRLRKSAQLRKAKGQNNTALIKELKDAFREISKTYVELVKEKKTKYLVELDAKGEYELICQDALKFMVDKVVSYCRTGRYIRESADSEMSSVLTGDLRNKREYQEVVVGEDAEIVEIENESESDIIETKLNCSNELDEEEKPDEFEKELVTSAQDGNKVDGVDKDLESI